MLSIRIVVILLQPLDPYVRVGWSGTRAYARAPSLRVRWVAHVRPPPTVPRMVLKLGTSKYAQRSRRESPVASALSVLLVFSFLSHTEVCEIPDRPGSAPASVSALCHSLGDNMYIYEKLPARGVACATHVGLPCRLPRRCGVLVRCALRGLRCAPPLC